MQPCPAKWQIWCLCEHSRNQPALGWRGMRGTNCCHTEQLLLAASRSHDSPTASWYSCGTEMSQAEAEQHSLCRAQGMNEIMSNEHHTAEMHCCHQEWSQNLIGEQQFRAQTRKFHHSLGVLKLSSTDCSSSGAACCCLSKFSTVGSFAKLSSVSLSSAYSTNSDTKTCPEGDKWPARTNAQDQPVAAAVLLCLPVFFAQSLSNDSVQVMLAVAIIL